MKISSQLPILLPAIAGIVLLSSGRFTPVKASMPHQEEHHKTDLSVSKQAPVVVELFTSEGCSSCPPADALLSKLAKSGAQDSAPIIVLAEHVDYWNHLGWADPFSSRQFTLRQSSYASLFRLSQVYTPQMVVDGQEELLGSDERGANRAITKAGAIEKTAASINEISIKDKIATVPSESSPVIHSKGGEVVDIVIAVTEDNLMSSVTRGENAGRRLPHVGVVRYMKRVGEASNSQVVHQVTKVTLAPSWKMPDLHAILFLQGHDSGRIYGASTASLQTK